MSREVKSADGTPIAYDCSGSGPPVVLIGGAFGDRREPTVAGIAQALADRFTVVNYDRRGRGESGDTQPYAVEREIEDVQALIRVVGGQVLVFGGSSGAVLALESAAAGAAITRLALFEPPYLTNPDWPALPSQQELADLVRAGRRGDAVELFLTRGAELPPEAVAEMRRTPFWPASEAVAHTLAYEAAIVGPGPIPVARLGAIHTPALVLVGSESSRRMRDASSAVAAALPNSRLHPLERQAHGRLDPVGLGRILVEFFES